MKNRNVNNKNAPKGKNMSFLKAIFLVLPLAAVASLLMSYYFTTQWIQPRFDEVMQKMEAATIAAKANVEAINRLSDDVGQ